MQGVHDLFFCLSGDLKGLNSVTVATRNLLALRYRSFAAHGLVHGDINDYRLKQVIVFCREICLPWLKPIRARLEKDHRDLAEYLADALRPPIQDEIATTHVSGLTMVNAIISRLADFGGDLKRHYSGQRGDQSANLSAFRPVPEEDTTRFTEFFLSVVDSLYGVFRASRCSELRWGLSDQAVANTKLLHCCLQTYIGQASDPPIHLDQPCQRFSDFALPHVQPINRFLLAADAWLKTSSREKGQKGVGDAIFLYLDIEPWLSPLMDDE
jgi:hypothetical protein